MDLIITLPKKLLAKVAWSVYRSSTRDKNIGLALALSLAFIVRYLVTVYQEWNYTLSICLCFVSFGAIDDPQVKLSNILNFIVWALMTSVLLASVLQIRRLHLATHFGANCLCCNTPICLAFFLFMYETIAIFLNYRTASDLWYPLRFLQLAPTLAVVLHVYYEIQFLLAQETDRDNVIRPDDFTVFNIVLNFAMIIHLGCMAGVGTVTFSLSEHPYLTVAGMTLIVIKLAFRIVMIIKYCKFYFKYDKPLPPSPPMCESTMTTPPGELVNVSDQKESELFRANSAVYCAELELCCTDSTLCRDTFVTPQSHYRALSHNDGAELVT